MRDGTFENHTAPSPFHPPSCAAVALSCLSSQASSAMGASGSGVAGPDFGGPPASASASLPANAATPDSSPLLHILKDAWYAKLVSRGINDSIAFRESIEVVKSVLTCTPSLDIDSKDKDGITALLFAASMGWTDVAQKLLWYGADKDITDERGRNAADVCESKGNKEMAQLIRGARVSILRCTCELNSKCVCTTGWTNWTDPVPAPVSVKCDGRQITVEFTITREVLPTDLLVQLQPLSGILEDTSSEVHIPTCYREDVWFTFMTKTDFAVSFFKERGKPTDRLRDDATDCVQSYLNTVIESVRNNASINRILLTDLELQDEGDSYGEAMSVVQSSAGEHFVEYLHNMHKYIINNLSLSFLLSPMPCLEEQMSGLDLDSLKPNSIFNGSGHIVVVDERDVPSNKRRNAEDEVRERHVRIFPFCFC